MKRFFNSSYVKAALTLLVSGCLLLVLNRWLRAMDFSAAFSTFNDTMMPIYIGGILAFLLCPIYNAIVRKIYPTLLSLSSSGEAGFGSKIFGHDVPHKKSKKNPSQKALGQARVISTIVCFAMVVGVFMVFTSFVLPQLITSVVDLVNTLPSRMNGLSYWAETHLADYPSVLKTVQRFTAMDLTDIMAWLQQYILESDFKSMAETVSTSIFSMVSALVDFIIGLLISIYLLNYKEKLFAICRKLVTAIFTEKKTREIYEFAKIINETFIGFIVGRIIDAVIIGILTFICMSILGMPMATLISVIIGVTNIIPFFGPFLGAIPSIVLLLLENPIQAFYFIILILVIQQVDGNIIGPRVVGNAIGIGSFWVLVAVLIGGGLFGFLGMALGVPVFAVIYRYVDKGTVSKLKYKNRPRATRDYLDYSQYNIDKEDLLKK